MLHTYEYELYVQYVYLYMYTIMIHNIQLSRTKGLSRTREKNREGSQQNMNGLRISSSLQKPLDRLPCIYIYIHMYLLESAEKCIDVLHLMILMYIYGIFFCTYIPYSFAGSKSSK